MSKQTPLEQLQALQAEFEARKAEIQNAAVAELAREISKKKEELAELQRQYIDITGKDLKGAPAVNGTRKRMTRAEQTDLVESLTQHLKGKPEGARMGELVATGGQSPAATRRALASIQGVTTTGNKAGTVYFLK